VDSILYDGFNLRSREWIADSLQITRLVRRRAVPYGINFRSLIVWCVTECRAWRQKMNYF